MGIRIGDYLDNKHILQNLDKVALNNHFWDREEEIQQYQLVRARFSPQDERTVKDEFKQFIGQIITCQFVWVADEDEQFAGEKIYQPKVDYTQPIEEQMWGWIPEQSLEILEVLEERATHNG